MKKTLLLILFFSTYSFAQDKYNSKDMNVSRADLELNTYNQDSTVNAIVLYEYGKAYIDDNSFDLVYQYKKKIKILNREGFNQANISVRLYNTDTKKEKISKIIATTTNLENGEITRTQLEDSQIFREKSDKNNTYVKFTLPNIKEGSVITFSYTFKSPYIFKYQPWYFQEDIPKLYSEYNTSIPANYEYNIKLVGELKLKTKDISIKKNCIDVGNGGSADCTISKYVIEDIPAFKQESYMRAVKNYLSRIEYELKTIKHFDGTVNHITKTWEAAEKELRTDENFGQQLKKKKLVKELIPETELSQLSTKLKKAKYIFNYVQQNYKWNKNYNINKDISVKELIKNKSGNVAELNLLLYNILEANDFSVNPVLLSTRDNGLVTTLYPVISEFNYIILKLNIDDKSYFLDATEPNLTFGQIPFRCLNDYGREIDFKNGSQWVDLNSTINSAIRYNVILTLNEDNTFKGEIIIKKTGYHALNARILFNKNKSEYLKYYKDEYPEIEFINIKVENVEGTNSNFNETIEISGSVSTIGDKLYLDPFLFKFFEENPLKLNQRNYPVDFGYKDSYLYNLKINTGNHYIIKEMPKETFFSLKNNSTTLSFKNNLKDTNNAELYFRTSFNQEVYPSELYSELKQFFSTLVDVQNNSLLVLEKNN